MIEVLSEFNVDFDLGTKLEGVTVMSQLQLQLQKHHAPFFQPLMIASQRFDQDVFIPAILAASADPTICDYNVRKYY